MESRGGPFSTVYDTANGAGPEKNRENGFCITTRERFACSAAECKRRSWSAVQRDEGIALRSDSAKGR